MLRFIVMFILSLLIVPAAKAQQTITYNNKSLRPIANNINADPSYPASKHAQLKSAMQNAKQQVAEFFGEQRATDPDVIFCKKQDCAAYFSGTAMRGKALKLGQTGLGAQYKAKRPTIVVVKQGRYGAAQLTHELGHIEVNARTANKPMPAWFHEGLATLMSGQPQCKQNDHLDKNGTHHLQVMQAIKMDWVTYTNDPAKSHASYCQAAHEVSQWISGHGKPALIKLLDQVKSGKRFDELYGAMMVKNRGT
jgi:hypothetical protein